MKSTGKDQRSHNFSLEQLNPPDTAKTVVASLFAKRSGGGKSIEDLISKIQPKLNGDAGLLRNFFLVINQTLGSSIADALSVAFDYEVAKESLAFYLAKDIPKISKENVPIGVSRVSFEANLEMVKKIEVDDLDDKSGLIASAL